MKKDLKRKILKLWSEGLHQAEIARQVGCSKPYVSVTIKKCGAWDRAVLNLPAQHHEWIVERAKKLRVQPGDMAARLLVEIIDMYKSGDY